MAIIVSIEGNIGSGKSTVIEFMKKEYENSDKFIFLEEPVSQWEEIKDNFGVSILSRFYENQKKYSFAFQMMAYISRLKILIDKIEENPDKIIVTERSLFTDKYVFAKMLYDNNLMTEIEYQIYNKWFYSFLELAPLSKLIYLKTDPNISYSRITKRNRDGEDKISSEYIQKCHTYHERMYENIEIDKTIIDCTSDFEKNENYFLKIKEDILNFIDNSILIKNKDDSKN